MALRAGMCAWHPENNQLCARCMISKANCESLPKRLPLPHAGLSGQLPRPIGGITAICLGTPEPSWIYPFPQTALGQSLSFTDVLWNLPSFHAPLHSACSPLASLLGLVPAAWTPAL